MKARLPKRPGKGKTLEWGRLLLTVNWSRSLDGWATVRGTAPRRTIEYSTFAIKPFVREGVGVGVHVYLLWLVIHVGWVLKGPAPTVVEETTPVTTTLHLTLPITDAELEQLRALRGLAHVTAEASAWSNNDDGTMKARTRETALTKLIHAVEKARAEEPQCVRCEPNALQPCGMDCPVLPDPPTDLPLCAACGKPTRDSGLAPVLMCACATITRAPPLDPPTPTPTEYKAIARDLRELAEILDMSGPKQKKDDRVDILWDVMTAAARHLRGHADTLDPGPYEPIDPKFVDDLLTDADAAGILAEMVGDFDDGSRPISLGTRCTLVDFAHSIPRHPLFRMLGHYFTRTPAAHCWCLTCRPLTFRDQRMALCPDCGNKRCPRATNHRHACTGSNEPGQRSSAYEFAKVPTAGTIAALATQPAARRVTDVASVIGHLPAPITNPEAWPPNYARGWNACAQTALAGVRESFAQPAEGAPDFHDVLYNATIKVVLDPADRDSPTVKGVVGATLGEDSDLTILIHAEAGGAPVPLALRSAEPPSLPPLTSQALQRACSAYSRALNRYGDRLQRLSPHEVAMRAALEDFTGTTGPDR